MLSDLFCSRAGVFHFCKRDYDRAIEDYDQAIRLSPVSISAASSKEFVYEYPESLHSLSVIYNNKGVVYHYGKRDYDRAIEDYNKSIRLEPWVASTYLNRGYAYDNKGDYDRAIKDYDNAVRLCPDYEFDFIDEDEIYWGKDALEKNYKTIRQRN